MLDPKLIREQPNEVKDGLKKRAVDLKLVDEFLVWDEKWRRTAAQIDQWRNRQKQLSKEKNIEEAKKLKIKIQKGEVELSKIAGQRTGVLERLPNLPSPLAPVGINESDNIVIKTAGAIPKFKFPPKNYLEIAEKMDIIDVARAARTTGSRFGYLKNEGALLELALIQLAFSELIKAGFTPVIPPVMIKPEVFRGMGRLAAGQEEERYFLPKDNLYLAGSAEHTLGPLHRDEILEENDLPKRYAGFSTCFRREAGSYGKDTKGILRVHQFDKVEMFSFVKPEDSEKELKFLVSMQEKLMKLLKLPYRVVEIATGDLGWTDAHQYDIEAWLPGENKYRETHSASNTTDFQARGVNVRFRRRESGAPEFVHMLNATGLAIGRTIIAIIENYQTKDGGIKTPPALLSRGCYIRKK